MVQRSHKKERALRGPFLFSLIPGKRNIHIDIAADSIHAPGARILQNIELVGVERDLVVLRQPEVVFADGGQIHLFDKPFGIAVNHRRIACVLDRAAERIDNLGRRARRQPVGAGAGGRRAFDIEHNRIGDIVPINRVEQHTRLLERLRAVDRLRVEIDAHVDARVERALDILLITAVIVELARAITAGADTDKREVDARSLDLIPIDRALEFRDIDTLACVAVTQLAVRTACQAVPIDVVFGDAGFDWYVFERVACFEYEAVVKKPLDILRGPYSRA